MIRRLIDDPFAVLGVGADSTPAELATARRRRAQSIHPDHGGDPGAMQALNAAYEEALRRRNLAEVIEVEVTPPPPQVRQRSPQRVQHDSPSFVVGAAPDCAHEALLVAAASIGEVMVESSPHMIECLLDEPLRCWCRLDLLPEGDATSVSLIVAKYDDDPAPDIDEVRDVWVASLNQL